MLGERRGSRGIQQEESRSALHLFDKPLMIITLLFMIVFLSLTLFVLWPYRLALVLVFLALLLIAAVGGMVMVWQSHSHELAIKKTRAHVLIESERGGVVLMPNGYDESRIIRYSHQPDRLVVHNPAPQAQIEASAPALTYPRTWPELVKAGFVFPGAPYVLGFQEDSKPIIMPDITGIGIGGVQGSGKTVTTLSLLMQSIVRYEGRLRMLVVDPQLSIQNEETLASKVAPLSPTFLATRLGDRSLPNPVAGGEDLIEWLGMFRSEFDRRESGGSWSNVWLLVADEFAALASDPGVGDRVVDLISTINDRARKIGMFAMVTTQSWKGARIGGTNMRQSIPSFILHQMPEAIARMVVPADIARQAVTLDTGEAILYSRGTLSIGRVPYVTQGDAEDVMNQFIMDGETEIVEVKTPTVRIRKPTQKLVRAPASPVWEGGGQVLLSSPVPTQVLPAIRKWRANLSSMGVGEEELVEKIAAMVNMQPEQVEHALSRLEAGER